LPIEVVDEDVFDPNDDDISIIGTSGHKITKIGGLDGLKLAKLCLRSHLIHEMEGMETLTDLTFLELYDNQIGALSQLNFMTNLTTLDMSFNVIRDMSPVANCPKLR
jgi:Leucine-rich repeat (LRR) protein